MKAKIVTLPGDGIGPEVVAEAVRVLRQIAAQRGHEFTFEEALMGGCAIDATGNPLPDENTGGVRVGGRGVARRGRRAKMVRSCCASPPGAGIAQAARAFRPVCQPAPGQGASCAGAGTRRCGPTYWRVWIS